MSSFFCFPKPSIDLEKYLGWKGKRKIPSRSKRKIHWPKKETILGFINPTKLTSLCSYKLIIFFFILLPMWDELKAT